MAFKNHKIYVRNIVLEYDKDLSLSKVILGYDSNAEDVSLTKNNCKIEEVISNFEVPLVPPRPYSLVREYGFSGESTL